MAFPRIRAGVCKLDLETIEHLELYLGLAALVCAGVSVSAG